MTEEKKVFVRNGVTYRVYAPYDSSKRWFVSWKATDGRWKKRYGDINRYSSREARMAAVNRLCDQLFIENSPKISNIHAKVLKYLDEKRHFWRLSTFQQNATIANVFFEFLDGRDPSADLIHHFFVDLRKKRHATTYNKYLLHLKQMFTGVRAYGYFEQVQSVKAVATPLRYFQPHQVTRLKRWFLANDPELWRYVQFIFYCFIRPKELRALQACDVLLEEGQIYIPGKKSKNHKPQYVRIPDAFVPELNWIYELDPAMYLFRSRLDQSKPTSRNHLYERHKKALDALNFGDSYALYSWKHTGAVMAAKAGISVKELQVQLRHHSLDETDKYLRQMGVQDLASLGRNFPKI